MPSAEAILFVAARHTQQKEEGVCFNAHLIKSLNVTANFVRKT
jgi:hypothetical protein